MIVFLKRLVGREEGQVREEERFKKNLNGFDAKQEELAEIETKLREVLDAIEDKQESIRARPRSSISGHHELKLGGTDGEEAPST